MVRLIELKPCALTVSLILGCSQFASAGGRIEDPTKFRIVPDPQVIEELVPSQNLTIPMQFDVLDWNVKKGDQKEVWLADLRKLSVDTSFVLLQEGLQDDFMPKALASLPELGWLMAKTFYMNIDHDATGVITGSVREPASSHFLRSRDLEPLIKTPKISLQTTYQLENGSPLMVINIHAINFQSPQPFYNQIDDIINYARQWKGKILFAGDFNTWIPIRLDYLIQKAKTIGLEHLEFAVDNRPSHKKLDHVLIRGCVATQAQILDQITSSDHPPLKLRLDCSN